MEDIQELIEHLMADPHQEPVASEILVLQSIYGDNSIKIYHPSTEDNGSRAHSRENSGTIRYEVTLVLPSPHEEVSIRVLVSLPPSYPSSAPPQLQLLSRYIGAYGVDSSLFGSILKTYISKNGVEWSPGDANVCVFDGLQNVLERCEQWYGERLSVEKMGEIIREDERGGQERVEVKSKCSAAVMDSFEEVVTALPDGIEMVVSEPITDRKSSFIGRACRISDPSQVPLILSFLMSDRRIARAAHPIINAWRCQVGATLHQDNDDDGETAAGGRIAHLLQILEVNNVLVVVTRYFGGIHLGPDRFKHINQAARNALELGGFLDAPETNKISGRGKKRS
ncbi:hypothetical protein JAAARDRAFT_27805 [Jaapia argillacea MUCL 33604]|uniref:RWD domain-containing protein n=1 Tax=Jaapia argillacea MUCL 33604 TaxID=933084 RepID=A0A067QAU6_9AGAM|nr:hypothetical protein JAAARDRAFT_27805 [Jaapia argillacea MUCL 33604]